MARNSTAKGQQRGTPTLRARSAKSASGKQRRGTPLVEYQGFVEDIEGETAFVKLTTPSGEVLEGEYPALALANLGIHLHRRFTCQTVVKNGRVKIELNAIADKEVTAEMEAQIDQGIARLVGDGGLDGDY